MTNQKRKIYGNYSKKIYCKNKLLGIMIESVYDENPKIIKFIDDFRNKIMTQNNDTLVISNINPTEEIRKLFHDGYCFYFAKMLEAAFPGGEVCLAYPYGHIVYVYNGIPYDIEGHSITESNTFIPTWFLSSTLNDFLHIDGKTPRINTSDPGVIEQIGVMWERFTKLIKNYGNCILKYPSVFDMLDAELTETEEKILKDEREFRKDYNEFMNLNKPLTDYDLKVHSEFAAYCNTIAWGKIK